MDVRSCKCSSPWATNQADESEDPRFHNLAVDRLLDLPQIKDLLDTTCHAVHGTYLTRSCQLILSVGAALLVVCRVAMDSL